MAETVKIGAIRSVNVTFCLVMESAEEFAEVYMSLQRRRDRQPPGPVRDRLLCLLDKMDVEFGKYHQPEDHLAEAEHILDRMRTWVDDIQDKLDRVHGSYQQGKPASSVDPN